MQQFAYLRTGGTPILRSGTYLFSASATLVLSAYLRFAY